MNGPFGGDARVVLRHHAELLHEGIAEVVRGFEALGTGDIAVGGLQLGVAFCQQLVQALVVDHLVGGEDIVVVVDLDVALDDDVQAPNLTQADVPSEFEALVLSTEAMEAVQTDQPVYEESVDLEAPAEDDVEAFAAEPDEWLAAEQVDEQPLQAEQAPDANWAATAGRSACGT